MKKNKQEKHQEIIGQLENCLGRSDALKIWPNILSEIKLIGSNAHFEQYLYGDPGDNPKDRICYAFGAVLYAWYIEDDQKALNWLLTDMFHFGVGELADVLDEHFWTYDRESNEVGIGNQKSSSKSC